MGQKLIAEKPQVSLEGLFTDTRGMPEGTTPDVGELQIDYEKLLEELEQKNKTASLKLKQIRGNFSNTLQFSNTPQFSNPPLSESEKDEIDMEQEKEAYGLLMNEAEKLRPLLNEVQTTILNRNLKTIRELARTSLLRANDKLNSMIEEFVDLLQK